LQLLQQPEYIHVLTNHLPLTGLFVAMLVLLAAFIARNRPAMLFGLVLLAVLALTAWPVYLSGEAGYDRVYSMADQAGDKYLDRHKELAQRWVFLYYITAGVAALGFALSLKWQNLLRPSAIAALVLAAASLAAGYCTAEAAGGIRHREFRFTPLPGSNPSSEIQNPARSGGRADRNPYPLHFRPFHLLTKSPKSRIILYIFSI
jgi:hypothetical protein